MSFSPRFKPIVQPLAGYQQIDAPTPTLLSDLFTIPQGANACWLQANEAGGFQNDTGAEFYYILAGDATHPTSEMILVPVDGILKLTNREQLNGCVLQTDGIMKVQFFTGSHGTSE